MNLVIIGTGYVGLISGLGYAKLGHRVAWVDIDANNIAKLDRGEVPFFEPGLKELLEEMQTAGQIMFTTNLESVMSDAEIVMIAVGTPSLPDGHADLSAVESVAKKIGQVLDHEIILVTKSTVPVGTNKRLLATVKEELNAAGHPELDTMVTMVSLPEFLREGSARQDFLNQDRIVIGCDDKIATTMIDHLHRELMRRDCRCLLRQQR